MLKPYSIFTDHSNAVLFVNRFNHLCFMCVFVMPSCLFLAALRIPVGKELTFWLYFIVFSLSHIACLVSVALLILDFND